MHLTQTQLDVIALLKKSENLLILPSSPIDGDSLGSALSLYMLLKKMGKKVTVVAEEEVPESYAFLPQIKTVSNELHFLRDFIVTIDCRAANISPEHIRHEIQGDKVNIIVKPGNSPIHKEHVSFSEGPPPFDCIVMVDAGSPEQFGKIYDESTELFHLAPVINIDHHASNTGFGKINLVDIMAPSTTTMILPLLEELGKELIDEDIATLLLAGLITDTGSFQNANTTPDAFSLAAKMIGYGARQQEIIQHIYKTKKLTTLRLWGRTLSKIQYDEAHKMVWSSLSKSDFDEIGGTSDETEGVIDELMSNAPGAEIVFLLKERADGEIGGSIRTLTPTIDASKLAGLFGGGGHLQAAGFRVKDKSFEEVESMVIEKIREFQAKRLRLMPEAGAQEPAQEPVHEAAQEPEPAQHKPMPMPIGMPEPEAHGLPTPPPPPVEAEAPKPAPMTAPAPSPSPATPAPEHPAPAAPMMPKPMGAPQPPMTPMAPMPAPVAPPLPPLPPRDPSLPQPPPTPPHEAPMIPLHEAPVMPPLHPLTPPPEPKTFVGPDTSAAEAEKAPAQPAPPTLPAPPFPPMPPAAPTNPLL
ncbi:hypothetical protein CO046_04045 [Candidatus Peregrinibacteria bacterium CG_4_9_14_0_2_um_filter_53_11]|nr:MAG: hypothetical protein CO046_04045 [Candidatus Peregrinibacteria bacterium CG_4_9_14_0_2_um_filter_53_11]